MAKTSPKNVDRWLERASGMKVTNPAKPLPKKKVKKGK